VLWALLRARTRADFSYRVSFALRLVSATLIVGLDFLAVYAVVRKVGSIGGWNLSEIALVYGLSTSGFRIADAFVGGPVERIATHLQNGSFDRFLTRPVHPLTMLCGEEFTVRRIGQLSSCLVVLIVALGAADVVLTPLHLAFVCAAVVGAAALSSAVFVTVCCLSFWSPQTQEIANAFTYGASYAAQYPAHIYDGAIRRLIFTVVPSAFTGYLPALVLLPDASNPLSVPAWVSWSAPLVSLPALAIAVFVWRRGLRSYRGTGS
jgi:ABC-2 type transport system permease protein